MDFAEMMEQERKRILSKLEGLMAKKAELEQEERALNIELAGIKAYSDAKLGIVSAPKGTRVKQTRGPRQSGVRVQILDIIQASPDGIKRPDLLEKLGAKGDKAKEQAISNALVALKKDDKITGERGEYKVVTTTAPVQEDKPKMQRAPKAKEEAPAV